MTVAHREKNDTQSWVLRTHSPSIHLSICPRSPATCMAGMRGRGAPRAIPGRWHVCVRLSDVRRRPHWTDSPSRSSRASRASQQKPSQQQQATAAAAAAGSQCAVLCVRGLRPSPESRLGRRCPPHSRRTRNPAMLTLGGTEDPDGNGDDGGRCLAGVSVGAAPSLPFGVWRRTPRGGTAWGRRCGTACPGLNQHPSTRRPLWEGSLPRNTTDGASRCGVAPPLCGTAADKPTAGARSTESRRGDDGTTTTAPRRSPAAEAHSSKSLTV